MAGGKCTMDQFLKKKVTRRSALKSIGTMGVAPLVLGPGPGEAGKLSDGRDSPELKLRSSSKEPDLHRMASGDMIVEFDKETGTIHRISAPGDPLGTNFLGNRLNVQGKALLDPHWTGDVVATAWHLKTPNWVREQSPEPGVVQPRSGDWQKETTLDSDDTRKIAFDANSFRVGYESPSHNPNGIRSFKLAMAYSFSPDGALIWNIEIANATDRTLELGELALPLRADDDYAEPYDGLTTKEATVQGKMAGIQKAIHEQKVLAHFFIAGHSSYALLQRPSGVGPFLLFRCEEDTSFECSYKAEGPFGDTWIGTDLLAIHSWAVYQQKNWAWNPWVNGHTSLILEPGQKKSYRLRFAFIRDYPQMREALAESGNLGIRILPSMVVREKTNVYIEVKNPSGIDDIEIHCDGAEIKERKRMGDSDLLTLAFVGRGQKSLRLVYGGGRFTWLHFYSIEDPGSLLKARARFMATRQFYENPKDPYNRNHVFLPFDYRLGRMIDDAQDVWEVGGTGDPGLGDPLFLAEKNVCFPSVEEIGKLETYIDDCLFRHIQNPKTYEVRDSLYWKVRYPSSPSSSFSRKRAEATWRTYNYTFVANIYHALYRIGKRYGLLRKRTAEDYLRMCWRTCLMWLTTGPFRHVGLITGSNAVEILADLEREGWKEEYGRLLALMKECNAEFLRDPYPYSSEIEIDETGQHQVYFFTRFFAGLGSAESRRKNADVVRALKALRGGDQPVWFNYGNDLFAHPDLRGQLSCWHSEALNGLALLTHFDDIGDQTALMKGYPGVWSVMHNVLPDGMGFAWFVYSPGIFRYEPPRTFEGGLGLWGFLRAAKSYVVDDPAFGLVGYGCRVQKKADEIRAFPEDGVRKRLRFAAAGIDIEAAAGEISWAALNTESGALDLELADSTDLVKTVLLTVRGLRPGEYEAGYEGSPARHIVKDILTLGLPFEKAKAVCIRRASED
jgi:hypothetical protein